MLCAIYHTLRIHTLLKILRRNHVFWCRGTHHCDFCAVRCAVAVYSGEVCKNSVMSLRGSFGAFKTAILYVGRDCELTAMWCVGLRGTN
jgi:hypothetical protein